MISITVDGASVYRFSLETPITETIDSTLDTFSFIMRKDYSKANLHYNALVNLKKYARVVVQDTSIGYYKVFALQSYTEKLEGETWIYNVDCVSPTKILENIIINGMASTDINKNWGQEVRLVIAKIFRQSYMSSGFNMTYSLTNELDSLLNQSYSHMFFSWDGQVTAREILDDMLGRVNYYITVEDFTTSNGGISSVTLGCKNYNGRDVSRTASVGTNGVIASASSITGALTNINNSLPDDYKIANVESYNNSEFEVSNLEGIMSNAVNKTNTVTTGFQKLRSDSLGIYSSSKIMFITSEPIYDIKYFNVMVPVSYQFTANHVIPAGDYTPVSYQEYGATKTIYVPMILDGGENEGHYGITGRQIIYEKKEFDLLPITTQKESLWYERGKCNIYGFTDEYKDNVVGRFGVTPIDKILNEITNYIPATIIDNGVTTWTWNEYISEPFEATYGIVLDNRDSGVDNGKILFDENMKLVNSFPGMYSFSAHGTSYSLYLTPHIMNYTEETIQSDDVIKKMFRQAGSTITYPDIETMYFDCAYVPYINSMVRLNKRDNERDIVNHGYTKNLSILSNQTAKTVDIQSYLKAQQATVDSMGERELIVDMKVKSTNLWNIGDYIRTIYNYDYNYWKLCKREITEYNENTVKVRYTFCYNYNDTKSMSIDREKTTYEIPLDGYVDRYIFINRAFMTSQNVPSPDTLIVYCWDIDGNPRTAACPLIKYGSNDVGNNNYTSFYKSSLVDNYSACIYKDTIENKKVNVPMRYCSADGTYYSDSGLTLGFTNYKDILEKCDVSKYPYLSGDVSSQLGSKIYNLIIHMINKDPYEKLIFVFEF